MGQIDVDEIEDLQIEEKNNYYEKLIGVLYGSNNSFINENIKYDFELEDINYNNYIDDTDFNTNEYK